MTLGASHGGTSILEAPKKRTNTLQYLVTQATFEQIRLYHRESTYDTNLFLFPFRSQTTSHFQHLKHNQLRFVMAYPSHRKKTIPKNHINQRQEQAKIRRLYEHNLDFGALLPVERFINDRMAVQETLHISNVSFCDVFRS